MAGSLPESIEQLSTLGVTRSAPSAPGPAEVLVRVAGCALGVEPQAEVAGEVVATGDAAAEWLGRRVVVPRVLPCGDCDRCRRGRMASCAQRAARHGLASHETVPARFLCALDGSPSLWPADWSADDLWRAAALADAASAPYAALARAGMGPTEWVAIVGGGPRAVFACAIVRAKGGQAVAIADPDFGERLTAAGAVAVVDAALAPAEAALELARVAGPPEIILETTGSSAGRHRALAMLPPGGCAVFLDRGALGTDGREVPPPDWERFSGSEGRLIGAEAAHPELLPELCALLVRGELPMTSTLVAIEPADLPATLAARRSGQLRELPIVRFR